MSVSTLPQVSLISSWFIPPLDQWKKNEHLPALSHALEQQILLHDLYFLHPADIAWYAKAAGMPAPTQESPLDFVSELTADQLDNIAKALTQYLADNYKGRLIGPRPRFTALATYWPSINTPDPGSPCPESSFRCRRARSVKAVRNSLYLAMKLGCHHVEIVGGSVLPEPEESAQSPAGAITLRRSVLVQSLIEVFTGPGAEELLGKLTGDDERPKGRPKICMEIEPGLCFLLKDVKAFSDMHQELCQKCPDVASQVLLNLDVAHMMLTEGDDKRSGAKVQLDLIEQLEIKPLIGHIHISDHTRSHASDLTPGTYHFYEDFAPWLKLAVELTQERGQFSKVIAVEMEACADIHEAARAIGRLRRWIQFAAKPASNPPLPVPPPAEAPVQPEVPPLESHLSLEAQLSEGAIIVIDIVNSTQCLTAQGEPREGAKLLEYLVSKMCHAIHADKGSAWSFTGDGLIAHFDMEHFLNNRHATAESAFKACQEIMAQTQNFLQEVSEYFQKNHAEKQLNLDGLSVRVGMHWGSIFVPTGGSLRFEAFGKDVVVGCRACDYNKDIEAEAKTNPEDAELIRKPYAVMTPEFLEHLPSSRPHNLKRRGKIRLKGIGEHVLYTGTFR